MILLNPDLKFKIQVVPLQNCLSPPTASNPVRHSALTFSVLNYLLNYFLQQKSGFVAQEELAQDQTMP